MKPFTLLPVLTLCALGLSACGDSKKASKSNFKKVLANYHADNCVGVSPRGGMTYPVKLYLDKNERSLFSFTDIQKAEQYDAFASAGLLNVENGRGAKSDGGAELETKTYTLTKNGEKALSKDGSKFCAGTNKIVGVEQITEPTQSWGFTISNVQYKATTENIAKWIEDEKITAVFPKVKSRISDNETFNEVLILTNDGWIHEKNMKM